MKHSIQMVLASGLLVLLPAACTSREETARVASPTLKHDALIIRINVGATSDYGYHVYLAPHGESYKNGVKVAQLSGAQGLTLRWAADNQLDLDYKAASHATLTNQDAISSAGLVVRLVPSRAPPPNGP